MREFEFLRNVTVGQYLPTNSPVHRLDPRTKLLLALLMVLAATSTTSLLTTLLLLGVLGGTTGIAQLDARYVLRGVLPVAPFLLFLMAMQLLFQGRFSLCSTVWYEWHFVRLTPCLLELVLLGTESNSCWVRCSGSACLSMSLPLPISSPCVLSPPSPRSWNGSPRHRSAEEGSSAANPGIAPIVLPVPACLCWCRSLSTRCAEPKNWWLPCRHVLISAPRAAPALSSSV